MTLGNPDVVLYRLALLPIELAEIRGDAWHVESFPMLRFSMVRALFMVKMKDRWSIDQATSWPSRTQLEAKPGGFLHRDNALSCAVIRFGSVADVNVDRVGPRP